jgi:hypothetical protein
MGLMRLGLSNPSANTDVAIYTATGPFLASIIATNKSVSTTANIRIWIVPSGATLASEYAYLAYDQDIVPQNTLETHRFALNQNDVVYVRADTADMSFMINGLKQVDIALAAGVTSYSNTPPLDVMDGMIWVDKDGNGTALDLDIYTKTEADERYVQKSGANYAISNSASTTVNTTTPTTIASITMTTNGRPVFLNATGDMNPTAAPPAWNYIQLYRNSTAIGKLIIIEASALSNNQGFAITHIDVPSAGTYTYTVKAYQGAGTNVYGETGNGQAPTLIGIELY